MIPMEIDQTLLNSRILIIDDDVTIGMSLEEILKDNQYSMIRYISDPRQVETVYNEFHPDIILLDIRMPHMDGFQVMEKVRSMDQSFVPILVLTGEMEESVCLRALSSGATDFLHKPMKMGEVLARIHNLLRVRKLQSELEHKADFLEGKIEDRTDQLKQAITQLDKMHAEVKDAYIETIYRLTRATEYKDEETADHVKRLSLYAAAMGKSLGMPEAEVELLLYASPMHDIGKIGIPDRILFKGEALTADEWKIMKTHPVIGYEILRGSRAPVLKLGAVIALNHHERWDGTGYPNGIKGEEIPLPARILALVDVYDALRSRRHYKEPFDHERSCKIILEGDGRVMPGHFDPKLIELFRKIAPEFEKIFEENNR